MAASRQPRITSIAKIISWRRRGGVAIGGVAAGGIVK